MMCFEFWKDGITMSVPAPRGLGDTPIVTSLIFPPTLGPKSMVAGLASMRLEKLYPGAMRSLIG